MLPALPGGHPAQNLNRTGVLLPKIGGAMGGGLGSTSYQFETKQRSPEKAGGADASKFKLKSTGGAGFSSSQTSSQVGASISNYEPSSASRRTPRRTLGAVLNANNSGVGAVSQQMPGQGSEAAKTGGPGGASNI